MQRSWCPFLLLVLLPFISNSQSVSVDSTGKGDYLKFKPISLLVPAALIGYGIVGLESHTLKNLNSSTQEEVLEHIDENVSFDDFSQYAPFVSVYALNAMGVKGEHAFADRTIILSTAYLIMGITVNSIKSTTRELRPDGSSANSFPSGHTATAFMGAEFLYQEYKNQSEWIGVAGYLTATATGVFRMYNNRHWLNDVAAGAGIGILSTKLSYWLYPVIQRKLFKKHSSIHGNLMPVMGKGNTGLCMVISW